MSEQATSVKDAKGDLGRLMKAIADCPGPPVYDRGLQVILDDPEAIKAIRAYWGETWPVEPVEQAVFCHDNPVYLDAHRTLDSYGAKHAPGDICDRIESLGERAVSAESERDALRERAEKAEARVAEVERGRRGDREYGTARWQQVREQLGAGEDEETWDAADRLRSELAAVKKTRVA